jgi:hypothetical protein
MRTAVVNSLLVDGSTFHTLDSGHAQDVAMYATALIYLRLIHIQTASKPLVVHHWSSLLKQ